MYLNIGKNTFIDKRDIILIVDKRQMSAQIQKKLSKELCQMEIDVDNCKSVIFLEEGGVVFSTVAPSTLLSRSKRVTV